MLTLTQTWKPRLTFPKLPFPNTRMNSKLLIPSRLEELTPTPFPSLALSFPCRLRVDLETSFCKGRKKYIKSEIVVCAWSIYGWRRPYLQPQLYTTRGEKSIQFEMWSGSATQNYLASAPDLCLLYLGKNPFKIYLSQPSFSLCLHGHIQKHKCLSPSPRAFLQGGPLQHGQIPRAPPGVHFTQKRFQCLLRGSSTTQYQNTNEATLFIQYFKTCNRNNSQCKI